MTINFSLVAIDQIVNHAAKLRYMSDGQFTVPLVIRTVTGGGGQLAATHSQSFENWYASVPGLKVAVPATPYDALGLFRTAMKDGNPILFAEHSLLYGTRGDVPDDWYEIPFGKADIKRAGDDVTIVAYSRMTHIALQAAAMLEERGRQAEVIDLRTLRPWDKDTVLQSVRKTNRVVVGRRDLAHRRFSAARLASTIQEEAFSTTWTVPSRVWAAWMCQRHTTARWKPPLSRPPSVSCKRLTIATAFSGARRGLTWRNLWLLQAAMCACRKSPPLLTEG